MKNIAARLLRLYNSTSLMLRIVIGLGIGTALGLTVGGLSIVELLGQLFVGAFKAIAPVLVFALVVASLAQARAGLGPRFRSVVALYMCSTLIAAVAAVAASMAFPLTLRLPAAWQTASAAPAELGEVFANLAADLTSNPVQAIAQGNYLCILMWAIVLGLAMKKCAGSAVIGAAAQMAGAITQVVRWIIACAPLGIMGLVYASVQASGLEVFTTYGQLILLLVGCMLATSLIVNPLIATCLLRRNAWPLLWQCLKGSAVSAFFTRSSAANIPVNLALCERLGLDRDFYSVSIPLGSTINMNGAAITITVMTLATCNTMGLHVPFASAVVLSVLATFAACGASGVPGGSLLLIPMACSLFGIAQDIAMQVVAIGFIINVVQDSMETALNSSGDAFFTATAEMMGRKGKAIAC